jgi:holo-[acyl-carrier protein] synthase
MSRVIAHGVDIVVVARVERIWREHGERFLQRVFTPDELSYCLDCKTPALRLSGRFAAKEAALKALGTGWRAGVEWTDVETLPDGYGKPWLTLHKHSAKVATELGIERMLVSISHAGEYAVASVIALGA